MKNFLRNVEALRLAECETLMARTPGEILVDARCRICSKPLPAQNQLGVCTRSKCRRSIGYEANRARERRLAR